MSTTGARRPPSHEEPAVHDFMAAAPAAQVAVLESLGLPRAVPLILVNTCENRCFFCASPGTIAVPASDVTRFDRIRAHLDARPEGVDTLWIAGNEPVLHPDFERTLAHAHAAGFRHIALMTSGLRLTDPAALARWKALGLAEVAVPIYSTVPALHDAVCGTPCFDRLVAGLDAARDAGLVLHLHSLALHRNLHDLAALAQLCATRWSTTLALAPLREKEGQFVWDAEAVPLAVLGEHLRALPDRHDITLLGMPMCVDRRRPLGSHPMIEMYFRTQRRDYGQACAPCADRTACPGVVAAQLKRYGDAGLAPRLE